MTKPINNSGKNVLITGASAGIGKAFAQVFAKYGFDVILTARREDRLQELADIIEEDYGVDAVVIPTDLADSGAPQYLYDEIESRGLQVDALINNAGYALPDSFCDTPTQEHIDFIQVMVAAPMQLCHQFLSGMKDRSYGRIINVASVVAFTPIQGSLYGAVKAFLVRATEALALELKGTGVHCTAVCPGLTKSEFHDVAGIRTEMEKYPDFAWMSAEAVAQQGYDAVMKGKIIHITGRANQMVSNLFQYTPKFWQYTVARQQSKFFQGE